jgi:hypothetical protein
MHWASTAVCTQFPNHHGQYITELVIITRHSTVTNVSFPKLPRYNTFNRLPFESIMNPYISRLTVSTNLVLGVRRRNRYNDKTGGRTNEEFWMMQRERDLHLLHSVQTAAEDKPDAYSTRLRALPLEAQRPPREANHSLPLVQRLRMRGLKPPLPHTLRWRSASLQAPRQISITLPTSFWPFNPTSL